MHQQMHITWVRRAYEGGLRLMIASVTDSEVLAMLWHRYHSAPRPSHNANYDYESARKQLRFIHEQVAANTRWMAIVTTPAQARRAIEQNKLAVILSLEMDSLTIEQMVSLKDEFGVRHVTPIHLVNNSFGGVAVYNDAFNTSNHFVNGHFYQVEGAPSVRFKLARPTYLNYIHGNPFESGGDLFKHGAILPSHIGDAEYHALHYPDDRGHRNIAGIDFGRLHMLMVHGFMLDLAHMSEHAQEQTLRMVEQFRYPVMNSHTGLRVDGSVPQGSERDMPRAFAQRIAALGGVVGLGTSRDDAVSEDDPVATWIGHYQDALNAMGGRGVALGTDMNGFAPQIPFARSAASVTYPIDLGIRLSSTEARPSLVSLGRHRLGTREFDFQRDGIAHYGMLPDFLQAVHTHLRASRRDADGLLRSMFNTAEDTIAMWERLEEATHRVRTWDKPSGTVPLDLYWSASRSDHFTTSTDVGRRDARVAGYQHVRTEGYVHTARMSGVELSPLKLYWSSERGDNFTTASPDGRRAALAAGYTEVARNEGHLSQRPLPGMVPVEHFWKDAPRYDNVITASSRTMKDARDAGYTHVRREGYILPFAVVLRAPNGMYLCAEDGGGRELVANRSTYTHWETFQVLYLDGRPDLVAFRTYMGYYLSAPADLMGRVSATGMDSRSQQRFEMIRVDDNHIALRAFNGRFVTAEDGGGGMVTANRTSRGDWEFFEVIAV